MGIRGSVRTQLSFAPIAPKYGNSHYDDIQLEKIKYRRVPKEKKEWNPDPYSKMLHDDMFKKWN